MEIVAIVSALITGSSLLYAIKTNKEKRKFEKLVKNVLAGIASNVWNARESADKADHNFTRARDTAHKLEDSDTKPLLLKHIHNGARDAVAAKKMLSNLLNEVKSMQTGMFGTETITHPEMSEKQVQTNDE